jgi:hypothetical protein
MIRNPALIPRPPQRPEPIPIGLGPLWLGSGEGATHRVFLPGVADRHAAVVERADGYWVIPGAGRALVNGTAIGSGVLLHNGDVIELTPGCAFRFDVGVAEAPPSPVPAKEPAAPSGRAPRKRPQRMRASNRYPPLVRLSIGVAALLVVASLALLYRAATHRSAAEQLSSEDAALFDSLLVVAYDHIERGSTLLEIGASAPALQDFAAGVNTLKTSRLRDHPYIRPRIEALEASVAAIYREKRIEVPLAYRNANRPVELVSRSLRAALSTSEFAARFADVRRQFQQRFRDTLIITGTDHAEHVSLYGRGGAMDIRARTLSADQTRFVVGACRAVGIRVKDFSQDSVLQRQIQSAIRAGLPDRAGTGVHLHIDRFANRRDAFTVQ